MGKIKQRIYLTVGCPSVGFILSLVSFQLDHRFEIQVLRDDGNYFSDFDTIVICFANFCLDISLFVFGHFVNGHLPKGRSFPKWQNGRQSQLCFLRFWKSVSRVYNYERKLDKAFCIPFFDLFDFLESSTWASSIIFRLSFMMRTWQVWQVILLRRNSPTWPNQTLKLCIPP